MALSGLEIYKLLPKTNCKRCGFPTCLAFAMALAQKKVSLDKCPLVSDDAKRALESASMPPVRLITFGEGENKLEIGNETVMFRHEEKFHHAPGIGVIIDEDESPEAVKAKLKDIAKLRFERVGQKIGVDTIALRAKFDKPAFLRTLGILKDTTLALILINENVSALNEALGIVRNKKPLIGYCVKENVKEFAEIAKTHSVPLIAKAQNLEELEPLVKDINQAGVKDIVLYPGEKGFAAKIWDLTQIRRLALKKSFRPFGYPALAFAESRDPFEEASLAAAFISKYAGMCLIKNTLPWEVLSILTVRQNIYTDPQKPLQVEPRIYEVGRPDAKSPVLVTTNFSLTYYTVESEVEASKKPSYIIACDTEGMSVLTAWAAEKFTASSISKAIEDSGIKEKVSHKKVIIPGYVSVLSGSLEEESGWKVAVGPREASGIPSFLKNTG